MKTTISAPICALFLSTFTFYASAQTATSANISSFAAPLPKEQSLTTTLPSSVTGLTILSGPATVSLTSTSGHGASGASTGAAASQTDDGSGAADLHAPKAYGVMLAGMGLGAAAML